MAVTNSSADAPETPAARADLACPCDAGATVLIEAGFSCLDFRRTLGRFATGVTVVTALAEDRRPIGLTISSFNSVSLTPPLILWSLSTESPNFAAFRQASHFAVNVLAADQQALSDRFASRSNNRFADLVVRPGLAGVPLIDGCCAWFECSAEAHYPGGDHVIFVGRVERFAAGENASPLLFHNCHYRRIESAGDPAGNAAGY